MSGESVSPVVGLIAFEQRPGVAASRRMADPEATLGQYLTALGTVDLDGPRAAGERRLGSRPMFWPDSTRLSANLTDLAAELDLAHAQVCRRLTAL